jgi:hypothetical protein
LACIDIVIYDKARNSMRNYARLFMRLNLIFRIPPHVTGLDWIFGVCTGEMGFATLH